MRPDLSNYFRARCLTRWNTRPVSRGDRLAGFERWEKDTSHLRQLSLADVELVSAP
jgi:hypothetical protein